MLKDDITLAQQIVSGKYNNLKGNTSYHNTSFIYKFTNEEINNYQKYLINKEKVLSVTASGDQILNSILEGTKQIDSCDISRFPQYFFELKKAAVKTLTKEEYLDFFINDFIYQDELADDIYDKVRNNIENDSKKFWDSLFNFFDGSEIYKSPLFSRELVIPSRVIDKNKYLQGNNYNILKEKLDDVKINHYIGDMRELSKTLNNEYDLVNLSSIIYYAFRNCNNYKNLLNNLSLSENGIALSYLYNVRKSLVNNFHEENYKFENFENETDGIMIYKKSRKV